VPGVLSRDRLSTAPVRCGPWLRLLRHGTGALLLLVWAAPALAAVLTSDQTWSGIVRVEEDLLVPAGITLTIEPGAHITFAAAPSTKTDPVFWNPDTELAVAGRLVAGAKGQAPVVFQSDGPWGGVVAAPGGEVRVENAQWLRAGEALLCVAAVCDLDRVTIGGGEYGLVLGPGAHFTARDVTVEGARVGVLDARGAPTLPGIPEGVLVSGAADAALLWVPTADRTVSALVPDVSPSAVPRVEYVGEYTVAADETWTGEVILAGRVTVIPEAVLTLAPGTRVRFRRHDSNGDGLGEGELLVLGGIRSRGLPGRPVIFESAEPEPVSGDWDKVSLIASEDPGNSFTYTVFRHGVQSLHAHFSKFVAEHCLFADNLRAVQFQESSGSAVRSSVFVGNKQALRFRDSQVEVRGNLLVDNWYAVHAYRCALEFVDNVVTGSALGGFLAKESQVRLAGNRLLFGRDGVRLRQDGTTAEITANLFSGFAEDALSLNRVRGTVEGNRLAAAGLDLISVEEADVRLVGNHLSGAGRDLVHLNGSGDLAAPDNYWGGLDPAAAIHDRTDDPLLGTVYWQPAREAPPLLSEPQQNW